MGNNLKISDLPVASRIDDEALVVLVQDHSNKVVTVSELSDKINERQNHTIDHLWHEMRRLTNADTVKAMSNSLANHEYRIDGIERLNGKQDGQLISLTKAMQDMSTKQFKHEGDIRLLRTANIENRRSLAYLNDRVDKQIEKSDSYFNTISTLEDEFNKLKETHNNDISKLKEYVDETYTSSIAYASTYIDSNVTYLSTYIHFNGDEYWGIVNNWNSFDYNGTISENDTFVPSSNKDNSDAKPSKCKENCNC